MSDKKTPGDSGPATTVPGARAALILLVVINLFNYIDRQVLSAVVPQIKETLLANPQHSGVIGFLLDILTRILGSNPENALVGLLGMAFMVSYMLFSPVLSALPIKRWWLIAAGITVWSLASGASGLATTFGALLLTRCFVGFGEAAYGPLAPSILSDYYPVEKRGSVLSWFYLAIPVGSALGFVMGGLVLSAGLSWNWAFYLVLPPGILLAAICLFMRDPRAVAADAAARARSLTNSPAPKGESTWQLYRKFWANKSFRANTIAMTAMTFAIGGIGFWMPTYFHEYRHAGDLAQVNLIFGAILVVSGLSATLIGGYMADKLRTKLKGSYFTVSGWAMIIAFPLTLGMLYAPFPLAWVFVFLTCFGLFLNTGPSNTALANVVAPHHRASAFALNILVIHLLGDVLSPLAIGAITDAAGNNMTIAFLVVSLLVLVGGIVWLAGAKHLDEDTRRISEEHD
ncbi:MAG: MFS transporter [Cyanobacteria bacterium SZAS LIN-2]|nr:MFS transporter [Cyanobacteria bacterium SZAS LIN-2]